MSNWALIVGIDGYDAPVPSLRGAVNDAVSFWRWCVRATGGGVQPANVKLLLLPYKGVALPADVLTAVDAREPTRSNFSVAVSELLRATSSGGERFFFYFAGHGITARINSYDQPAICLSDFSPDLTTNAMSLSSLFERFRSTNFAEQFFYIDACRNLPFSYEYRVSDFDLPVAPSGEVFPQFITFATQPRNVAAEIGLAGDEGGAFSKALMDGLAGLGAAKQWDAAEASYVVRWSSLFKYVDSRVSKIKQAEQATGGRRLIQAPMTAGEKGSQDPILGKFPEMDFASQRLTLQIDLDPREAAPDIGLNIVQLGDTLQIPAPLGTLPHSIDLPPRVYGIIAMGHQYERKRPMAVIELYEAPSKPVKIELQLVQTDSMPTLRGPGGMHLDVGTDGGDNPSVASFEFGHSGEKDVFDDDSSGHSDNISGVSGVFTKDALARLELADESGHIIASGRSILHLPSGARRGFYRARIITPEGQATETLLEMAEDGGSPAELVSPLSKTPGLRWAVKETGLPITDAGMLIPSEAMGESLFIKLSTLLALAAAAKAEEHEGPPGGKLRRMPFPGFRDQLKHAASGIQVVLGDEMLKQSWNGASLNVVVDVQGRQPQQHRSFIVSPASNAVASVELALDPGSYWVDITAPAAGPLRIAVSVLPGRLTLLILTHEMDASLDLHAYSVLVGMQPVFSEDEGIRLSLDPMFSQARFAVIRRIEFMQRSFSTGQLSSSLPDIELLLLDKWIDPIAGCLGGYLLLRLGRAIDLEVPANNLCRYFGGLPDAFVLRALYCEASSRLEDARANAAAALNLGVPTFADGIRHLAGLVSRLEIQHDRARAIVELAGKIRVGGLLSVVDPS